MHRMGDEVVRSDGPGPWFRRYPRTAGAVAVLLFALVTALRFGGGDERAATALLFALPITLVALAFGERAGAASAAVAVGVLVTWVLSNGVDLSPMGWASRVVPLVLLGFLVGRSSDQLAEAEQVRLALAVAEERQRDAAEINDGILQQLAVAKWRIESGRSHAAEEALDAAIQAGERLVVGLLGTTDLSGRLTTQRHEVSESSH